MGIEIECNNVKIIYFEGYKKYFYAMHRMEIIINAIVMLLAIISYSYMSFKPLSIFVFLFSVLYLSFIWLFYYGIPIGSIKRKSDKSATKYIITEEKITIYGDDTEYKYAWKAVKEICLLKEYIYIVIKDNTFIIFHKNNFNDTDLKRLDYFFDNNNLIVKELNK